MGALETVLDSHFGTKTRSVENPVIAAIPAVAGIILRNNPDRLAFVIVNLGANPAYLGLTNAVGVANGIYVPANGGSVTMYWQEDFQMVGWAWWAVAPAGASNCYVLEVIGR